MSGDDANPREGFLPISPDGLRETLLATLASAALAGLIAFMHPRGFGYWMGGIAALYGLSLRLSLRIHALSYRAGVFRGEPLAGKPVEFRGTSLASIAHDARSRPPRARLELKDGRRILIKMPRWLGPASALEFESKVKARIAEAHP